MAVPYKLNYFEIETGIDSTSTFIHTGDLTATKVKKYLATSNDILLGDGTTTSLSGLQPTGNYITALTGEATATGPGSVAITLTNSAVIGKVLTGLSITGSTITSTDTILQAFGKVQNQINGKQDTITLTTTGTSGAATLIANTLNIPQYTDAFVGTVTSVSALTLGTTGTDLSSTVANSTTTPVITLNVPTASATNRGALSSADWTTFNSKQDTITLTTTGSSGASTFISNTLNVPTYTLSGLGGVPTTRTITINGTSQDLSADRTYNVGTVTSVGLTMPAAFSIANSPVTTSGTIAVTGAGLASQYIRGDGALADFPTSGGGGSSVSYYLNGSISQGTIGGNAYYEMNKTPVIGTGTDFTIGADGYIAQFITDANDPASLLIPAGNWNVEMYFSASSSGGTPSFYVEVYKYNGTTFTLLGSSATTPEGITNGTAIDIYYTSVGIPETVLTITDRLAIRVYVTHSGRTITLHTEDNHLSEIVTTFSNGLTALNGLTKQAQYFAVGSTGTDFNISSSVDTHTFNIPSASASNRGLITTGAQTFAGQKTFIDAVILNSTLNLTSGALSIIYNPANTAYWQTYVDSSNVFNFGFNGTNVKASITSGGNITGASFIKSGGTSSQFLKADGSVDSTAYGTGSVTSVAALTLGTTGTDLSSTVANGTTTPVITLNVPDASATARGVVTTGTQTFAGDKTLTGSLYGIGLSMTGTSGDIIGSVATTGKALRGTATTGFGVYSSATTGTAIYGESTGTGGAGINGTAGNGIGGYFLNNATGFATLYVTNNGSGNLANFSNSAGTKFTINNAGNLGNGTYTYTLPSATGTLALTSDITSAISGTTNYIPKFTSANVIGNSNLINDASGNLGLGVTPSAGGLSGYTLFEMANGGASIYSGANQNLNGTNISWSGGTASYKISNFATLYNQQSGQHQWLTAPSGTAGNAISFTQAMTLFSDGNLLLTNSTVTNAGYKLDVNGTGRVQTSLTISSTTNSSLVAATNSTTGYTFVDLINNGASGKNYQIGVGGNGAASGYANNLYFDLVGVGNVMTLTSGRNVLIGTTTDAGYKLDVNGTFRATGAATFSSSVAATSYGLNNGTFRGGLYTYNLIAGTGTDYGATIFAETSYNIYFCPGGSATKRMTITSGGNVLIGTTTDNGAKLQVQGSGLVATFNDTTSGDETIRFLANGTFRGGLGADSVSALKITGTGGIVALVNTVTGIYTATSDVNKKKDFEDSKLGLNAILGLKPTLYRMKSEQNTPKNLGFIAQEVREFIPQAYVESGSFIGLTEMPIIATLVKAIQELKAEIDILKNN
jgi:hypothetical protein